ncbi:MAG: ATP-dependent RNA helicase DbpA [Pseudomonadales bacterium]
MTQTTAFDALPLRQELLQSLADLDYQAMTAVQAQSLPALIEGRDVIARASTGSGKTVAFGLGILQHLEPESFRIQSLILCPTRELAEQVAGALRTLAKGIGNVKVLTLCGGVSIGPQIGSLKHSAHIIVGTPGRVLKHLTKKTVRFKGLQSLVLDEADRMLDMGFADEIDEILSHLPRKRQSLLFSATYTDTITSMSDRVLQQPVVIDVTEKEPKPQVDQLWLRTERSARSGDLLRALSRWGGALNLVFCNTKIDCAELYDYLSDKGVSCVALHGDLEQADRSKALIRFANHSATVMIATDVAARGLDIKALDAVFNYELPNQPEVYTHRIGRTGRAGSEGVAISLVANREQQRLSAIEAEHPDLTPYEAAEPLEKLVVNQALNATMATVEVNGGRKHKLRAGDLLGALTATGALPGTAVGKIDLQDTSSYVAVEHDHAKLAVKLLNQKIKGRTFRARLLR